METKTRLQRRWQQAQINLLGNLARLSKKGGEIPYSMLLDLSLRYFDDNYSSLAQHIVEGLSKGKVIDTPWLSVANLQDFTDELEAIEEADLSNCLELLLSTYRSYLILVRAGEVITKPEEKQIQLLKEALSLTNTSEIVFSTGEELSKKLCQNLQELADSPEKQQAQLIPTPFQSLNNILNGGAYRGDFVVIAGLPGSGKSTLMYDIFRQAVLKQKKKGLIFSFEISQEKVMKKLMAAEGNLHYTSVLNGTLLFQENDEREDNLSCLKSLQEKFSRSTFDIRDPANCNNNIEELIKQAEKYAFLNQGIDLILVDYIQLMNSQARTAGRVAELTLVTKQLKLLAGRLNCVVIAGSQVNRDKNRKVTEFKHPKDGIVYPLTEYTMSDVKDSGSIEQDADTLLFIDKVCDKKEVQNALKMTGRKYNTVFLQAKKVRSGSDMLTIDNSMVAISFNKRSACFESISYYLK